MPANAKIFNESDIDLSALIDIANKFLPHAQSAMGFSEPVTISLVSDKENSLNPLGKTAYYDPAEMGISLFVDDRHPKDILRSLSHELVHHTQNCNGMFDELGEMSDGYAQEDDHLREMEREAYELGNMCFRDWEDEYKKKQQWQLNEGALEDLFKSLKTQRGAWKNPIKGFAQAATPGAGLTPETFGLGQGEKSQPHFTEEDPGPHWDERPVPLKGDVDIPGIGDSEEDEKVDSSRAAKKERASTVKGWIEWIFMHQGEKDRKKAFYSALYEDELDTRLKMSVYKEYSRLINKKGYGEKETAQPELDMPPYAGSDTEAGQGDLFAGPAPIRGGEEHRAGPEEYVDPRGIDVPTLPLGSPEAGPVEEPLDIHPDWIGVMDHPEFVEDIDETWAAYALPSGQPYYFNKEENWSTWDHPYRDGAEDATEMESSSEAPGAQTREYETPEYAESEKAFKQHQGELSQLGQQQAQLGRQASRINRKMINSAARKALRSIGLPKNAINKGNLHKVVKSVTSRDANIDYMNFEKELLTSGAFKTVPVEQQRELAKAIANELQSIGGVNFQFYDTPETRVAAEGVSYEEETLDDLGDVIQARRGQRRSKAVVEPLEPATESLTFDEELKIRAAVHSAMDLLQERIKTRQKQKYESSHLTINEMANFARLAGVAPLMKKNEIYQKGLIAEGKWTDRFLDFTRLDQAHKWKLGTGTKVTDWDEEGIAGTGVGTGLAKAGSVLGHSAAAEDLEDEKIGGRNALDAIATDDYEARAQENAEQVEMAFEEGYAQMADEAYRASGATTASPTTRAHGGDPHAMRASPTDRRTILRLGVRLTGDDGKPIEAEYGSPEYKKAMKSRAVYNDQNEFMGYNLKHHEIAQAAERKRATGERFRLRRSGADWVGPDGKVRKGTGEAMPPGDYMYDELARYEQAGYGSVGEGWWTFTKNVAGPIIGGAVAAEALPLAGKWGTGAFFMPELVAGGVAVGNLQGAGEYALDALEMSWIGQGVKGLFYAGYNEREKEAHAQRLHDEGESSWSDQVFGRFGNTVRKGNRFRDEAGSNMLGFGGDPIYGSVDTLSTLDATTGMTGFGREDPLAPEQRSILDIEKFKPDSIDASAELEASSALYGADPKTGERVEIDRLTIEEWEAAEKDWIGDDPMNIAIAKGEYINRENWPSEVAEQHEKGFCNTPGASVFRASAEYKPGYTGLARAMSPQDHTGRGIFSSIKPVGPSGPVCGLRNVAQMHIDQDSTLNFLESAGGTLGGAMSHRERFIKQKLSAHELQSELADLNSDHLVYADLLKNYNIQTFGGEDTGDLFAALDIDLQRLGANLYQNQPGKVDAADRLKKSLERMAAGEKLGQKFEFTGGDDATLRMILGNYVSTDTGRAKMEQLFGLEMGDLRVEAFGRPGEYAITDADLTLDLWRHVTVPYVDLAAKQQAIIKYIRHEVRRRSASSKMLFGVTPEELDGMNTAEILGNERLIDAFANNENTKRPFRARLASRVLSERENPQMLVSKHREEMEEVELILQVNTMQNIYSKQVRAQLKKSALPEDDEGAKHDACALVSGERGASKAAVGCRQTTKTREDEEGNKEYLWEPIPEDDLISNTDIRSFEENSFQGLYFQFLRQEGFGNKLQYESMLISASDDARHGLILGFEPSNLAVHGKLGPVDLDVMAGRILGVKGEGWEKQQYKIAAFNYARLHQTKQDSEVSNRWLSVLRNTDNKDLTALFTGAGRADSSETEKGPLENIKEPISMFEIILTLADPPIQMSEEELKRARKESGMIESQIVLLRQGALRREGITALHAAGMLSDEQFADAKTRLSFWSPLKNTAGAPGYEQHQGSIQAKRGIPPGARVTLTGKADFLNWFQEVHGQQYVDNQNNILPGGSADPAAVASFTKSLALIERTGAIADMHRYMQEAPVTTTGGQADRARQGAEISNSIFMEMWYEEYGADDSTREWVLRYAPDILFKHLYAQDRRAQMMPGSFPAVDSETGLIMRQDPRNPDSAPISSGPAIQMLQFIRKTARTKRGRGQATPGRAAAHSAARENNQSLPVPSAMAQLDLDGQHKAANLQTKQQIANGDMSQSFFKVPFNGNLMKFGSYDPTTNEISLYTEREMEDTLSDHYGTDNDIDYTDEQTFGILIAASRAIQEDLGLSAPPAIYDGRKQIWPPAGDVRENIRHSLRHLPNDKLIKEQITKAFVNKDISISRKRLEEVVRKHILQELINNA